MGQPSVRGLAARHMLHRGRMLSMLGLARKLVVVRAVITV